MEKGWTGLKNHSRMMVSLFLNQPSECCCHVKANTIQQTVDFGVHSGIKSGVVKQLGLKKNGPDGPSQDSCCPVMDHQVRLDKSSGSI